MRNLGDFGYVYLTTNLIDGMVYIGQKHGKFTQAYLGSGVRIKLAARKYGRVSFSVCVVATADSQNNLDALEIYFIGEYRKKFGADRLYNLADGGYRGVLGYRHTEESKVKIRENRKRQTNSGRKKGCISWNKGGKMSAEYCQINREGQKKRFRDGPTSNGMLGRRHTEESKKLMSSSKKGKPTWNIGVPQSEEAKNKQRVAMLGKPAWNKGVPQSEAAKNKQRTAMLGKPAWNKGIRRANELLEGLL